MALAVLTGATYFSNFEVRTTPDAPWERHLPPMPPDTLTKWSLSPVVRCARAESGASALVLRERRHAMAGRGGGAAGLCGASIVIARPRIRGSRLQGDFSKRLEPQPGMKVVYARTTIDSDRDQVKKLYIGYSDDVSVFLNGKILYRGRSAQGFRDPGFPRHREPGERRGLPSLEEGQQRTDAGGQRTRRRMGIHLPVAEAAELRSDGRPMSNEHSLSQSPSIVLSMTLLVDVGGR